MNPPRFAVAAGAAAIVLCLSGISADAAGHGGGGGGGGGVSGGGGGGHGPGSAGAHGGPGARGYSGGPGGRYGMHGYPGINGGTVRGRMLPPYVPATAARGTGVHNSQGTIRGGDQPRLSSSHSSTRQSFARTNVNGVRTAGHHQTNGNQPKNAATSGRRNPKNLQNHEGLDPQTQQRLRNWQGPRADLSTARQRHRDWSHNHHHGHDWWHHHCDTIIFVDWGWWGWWDGWWFPAWGYDPYYSEYAYDGPIYGYNGLPPDEAVASVQQELQRLGYFTYAVDGKLGPLTQSAINRYQRDHRLPITGTIDPATINSLGLTQ